MKATSIGFSRMGKRNKILIALAQRSSAKADCLLKFAVH
jgi:hypothetical protein